MQRGKRELQPFRLRGAQRDDDSPYEGAAPEGAFCPPCGACRQFLAEFNPDMAVVLKEVDEPVVYTLRELLPLSFSLDENCGGAD